MPSKEAPTRQLSGQFGATRMRVNEQRDAHKCRCNSDYQGYSSLRDSHPGERHSRGRPSRIQASVDPLQRRQTADAVLGVLLLDRRGPNRNSAKAGRQLKQKIYRVHYNVPRTYSVGCGGGEECTDVMHGRSRITIGTE